VPGIAPRRAGIITHEVPARRGRLRGGLPLSAFGAFWVLFILATFLWPVLRQRRVQQQRLRALLRLQRKRGSRVITLIHRQEAISFLGIPLMRYIDIEDSERVLRAIRLTARDAPLDIILHTPGGLVLAAEQIAHAIARHPGPTTVLVPHYAMSGGTLLALAADRIMMDENAVLGPVDPQVGSYPAASILRAVREKSKDELDDKTVILADVAEKATRQVEEVVRGLLADRVGDEKAREAAAALTEGRWTHDYPLTPDKLIGLGLEIDVGLPREVYELMELYPQPGYRRPSVQYVPAPQELPGADKRGE